MIVTIVMSILVQMTHLCSKAYTSETFYDNFNKLLQDEVQVLENIDYNLFTFDLNL